MYSPIFLPVLSGVLLASIASVLSNDTDGANPTTTFKGFSFAAKATPNAAKGSSDNQTLLNIANMQVRHLSLLIRLSVILCPQSTMER